MDKNYQKIDIIHNLNTDWIVYFTVSAYKKSLGNKSMH